MSRDSSPRKGDIEYLFAFARRISALEDAETLEAAALVLDALAEVELESEGRFGEIDASLVIMCRALAEAARSRLRLS